ncbi:hypothetical protein [Nocardiopsis lucentensis]|uniref:hypothetical protein n=1 Tax=Nocardiopsis lucentensis TaxID=53441 RepID=UPI00034939BC|nr:hypothetical protein [Nocardiopsis lucentensis]
MHSTPKAPGHLAPEKKVTAAGASGAAVTVLIYVAGLFGLDVPEVVAAAAVTLVAAAAAYLAPHTRRS